ncbi:tetraspanin-5-like [Acanthochromis polyacanthus]|uniref:Tetraspanin-5-like n=1 Tax=Acanthochromis polyacanthus TaxID=80966 RepID=A0A3Q1EQ79_9TELE|nr:tetraspanin-5-like [Acanthochromis polyacanthus]
MGKINGCLKCLFIFFNVIYAILGCVLMYGTVKVTVYSSQLSAVGGPGLGWAWVFAIGILGISCLGIYAGCSEKALFLKIFAGFMGVGMVIMLICGIIVAVKRNQVRDAMTTLSSEYVKPLLEDNDIRAALQAFQEAGQCCGVMSAEDWGNEIPDSCRCSRPSHSYGLGYGDCKSKPQGYKGPDSIYAQTCGGIIFMYVDLVFKAALGFFFGFAITALFGLLISLLMVHQVKRHDGAGGSSLAMKGY